MLHQSSKLFAHYDRPVADSLTESGALLLADTIRCYWRGKGKEPPQMRLEYFSTPRGKGSLTPYVPGGVFAVRSDMVGGLPRED